MSDFARFIKRVQTQIEDGKVLEAHQTLSKYPAKAKLPFPIFMDWIDIVAATQCGSPAAVAEWSKHAKLTADERALLDSYLFVDAWLLFNQEMLEVLINKHHDFTLRNDGVINIANARIHFQLCIRLLAYRTQKPEGYSGEVYGNVIFLGDSHALTPSRRIMNWRGRPVLAHGNPIRGVKMYHLGRRSPLKWKTYFREKLKNLHAGCDIILSIGEIDCRPNEGIFYTGHKRGKSPRDILDQTVQEFVDFASEEFRKIGRDIPSITLMGTPFPVYDIDKRLPNGTTAAEFLEFLATANNVMRDVSLKAGWDFLDVYAATQQLDKDPKCSYRIDNIHLSPNFYDHADKWRVSSMA